MKDMPRVPRQCITHLSLPLFLTVQLFLSAALLTPAQAQNPSGYWTFDDGVGAKAADSSGNGLTATLVNGVSWIGSPVGSGVAANGSSRQFVSTPPINLSETRAVTVSLWVNRAYSDSGGTVLFEGGYDSDQSKTGFWLLPDDDICNGIQVGLRGDVGSTSNCYRQPTSGDWHYLAVVLDKSQTGGNEVAFYVDGVLQVPTWNLTAATNTNNFGNDPVYLFAREGTSAFSSGMIADLRIYKTALDAEQIQKIFRGTALMRLTLAPPSVSIPTGTQVQFTATGIYQDGSVRDLTNSAAWTATDPSVGSIGRGGVGIGAGTGTTTIIASLGRITGSAGLMVTTAANSMMSSTSTVGPLATSGWQQGFDFRKTPAFVTDPSGSVYVVASTSYPTTYSGTNYGWVTTSLVGAQDRGTSVDPRLAGINFANNGKPAKFYVDLPSSGAYNLALAMGDASYAQCQSRCQVQFLDGSTVLTTLTGGQIAAGYFYDANGNQWPAAQWSANNQTRQVTLSGTRLTVVVGTSPGVGVSGGVTPLAYLGVIQVSSGGDFTLTAAPTSRSVVQGNQGTSTLTTTVSNGFNNAITLSASGVPTGTTVSFSPNPIAAPGSGSSTMTIAVGSSTPTGTYAITVTGAGGGTQHTATVTLTVTAPVLVSIAVTPANASLAAGQQQQFTATGTYSDGSHQNLTSTATWSSSAPAVATIAAGGMATGVAAGSTVIQATSGSINGSTKLTVTGPTLVSITVTPANPSIAAGQQQQFTATGNYSDGSHQNLTSTATWSSSAPAIATVSAGLATSLTAGTTTIKATSSSISGSTTLTVTAQMQHSVALSWNASTSQGIAGYNAYRSTVSGGPYTLLNSSLIATTSYTDLTVQSGVTYYYVTTAVDSQGVESVYSNEAVATVP